MPGYCRPTPPNPAPAGPRRDSLPEPPPLQEDLDVSQAGPILPPANASPVTLGGPLDLQAYHGQADPGAPVPDLDPIPTSSIPGSSIPGR